MTLQSDPGWLPARNGCLSASRFKDAIDFLKNGKESSARRLYRNELVAERIAGYAISRFVNPAMQRGLDLEPAARDLYEETTGQLVGPARLFIHPNIDNFVATPDGTIDKDTLIEFKCPQIHTYINWLEEGQIPEEHLPQLACQLLVTGRKTVIFCAYCPEMPAAKRLFIRSYTPSPDALKKAELAAITFLNEVDFLFDKITMTEPPKREAA